ncbi:MAG: hypothetical protein WD004_03995 [Actinomycetota bacterium]
MRVVELVVAGLLILGGIRSLVVWTRRRRVDVRGRAHLVLFALFVTARVGLWLSLAGLFLISASVPYAGRAFVDEMTAYRWYLLVPLVLGVLQIVTGYFLGRGSEAPPAPAAVTPAATGSTKPAEPAEPEV